jgi:hypothetical protein
MMLGVVHMEARDTKSVGRREVKWESRRGLYSEKGENTDGTWSVIICRSEGRGSTQRMIRFCILGS